MTNVVQALSLELAYEGRGVRVVGSPDAPRFVVADVCDVLGIERANDAARGLQEDEKGTDTIRTLGGPQEMLTVTEPGLYALIARSRKPAARRFDRWVRHEVLPEIRRTGTYGTSTLAVAAINPQARAEFKAAVREALDEHEVATKQDVHEVLAQVRTIHPRKDLKESDKLRHRLVLAKFYACKCPKCRTARIVFENGDPIAEIIRYDHFENRSKNAFEKTWAICTECHDELDGEPGLNEARLNAKSAFDAYQIVAANLSGTPDGPSLQVCMPWRDKT